MEKVQILQKSLHFKEKSVQKKRKFFRKSVKFKQKSAYLTLKVSILLKKNAQNKKSDFFVALLCFFIYASLGDSYF